MQLAGSVAFLPAFFVLFFAFGGSVADGDVPLGVAWGRLFSTLLVTLLAFVALDCQQALALPCQRQSQRQQCPW